MNKIIKELQRNQKLASFFWDESIHISMDYCIGRVIAYDSFHCILKLYSKNGQYAGIYIGWIVNLCKIDIDSLCLKYIEELIEAREKSIFLFDGKTDNLLYQILVQLRNKEEIAYIGLSNATSPLVGIIREIGDDILAVEQIHNDGYSFVKLGCISDIFVDIEKCNKYKELPNMVNTISNEMEVNSIYELLKELQEKGQLAEFCWDINGKKYVIGRVVLFDKSDVLIEKYDLYGCYDGLYVNGIETICRITIESKQLKIVENLLLSISWQAELPKLSMIVEDLRKNIFLYSKNKEKIISMELVLDEAPIFGIIRGVSNDFMLKIEKYDSEGMQDGFIFGEVAFGITIKSKECRKIETLAIQKKKHICCSVNFKKKITIHKLLNELQKNQKLACYIWGGGQNDIGRVLAYDQYSLLIEVYDMYGSYNGIQLCPIEELCRIETDSKSIKIIERLIDSTEKYKMPIVSVSVEDLKRNVLMLLKDKKELVWIEMYDEHVSVMGTILDIGDSVLTMQQFDMNGMDQGLFYEKVDDICYVKYDSQDCSRCKLLM